MIACGRFKVHVRAAKLITICSADYEAMQLIHLHGSAAVTVEAWVVPRRNPSSVHHCLRLGGCTPRHIDGAIFQALNKANACLARQSDCEGRPQSRLTLGASEVSQRVAWPLKMPITGQHQQWRLFAISKRGKLVCARFGGDPDDLTTAHRDRLG